MSRQTHTVWKKGWNVFLNWPVKQFTISTQISKNVYCSAFGVDQGEGDGGDKSPRIWSSGTLMQIVPLKFCYIGTKRSGLQNTPKSSENSQTCKNTQKYSSAKWPVKKIRAKIKWTKQNPNHNTDSSLQPQCSAMDWLQWEISWPQIRKK